MSTREALRNFYKIQAQRKASVGTSEPEEIIDDSITSEDAPNGPLDAKDVDVDGYVHQLTTAANLPELAKTAAQLDREIKTLDSEQKALVYNNYQKLIRASQTLDYLTGKGPLAGLEALAPKIETIAQQVELAPSGEVQRPDLASSWKAFQEKYPAPQTTQPEAEAEAEAEAEPEPEAEQQKEAKI